MKYLIIATVMIILQSGCRKPETNKDFIIAVDTNNIIRIGDIVVKAEMLEALLEYAAPRMSNSAFVVNLSFDSFSNSLPYLTIAEKHGITNFCVRTKQVFPPIKPHNLDAIY